jgi:hypothetical protein
VFKTTIFLLISCLVLFFTSLLGAAEKSATNGPYLGQTPPGDKAELFAPGIVSDGFNNRDIAMMPDGSAFYYAVNLRNFELSTIFVVQRTEDGWDGPRVADFARNQKLKYLEPAISPDGSKFFFVSSSRNAENNNDIWVMNRESNGWGQPEKLGGTINTNVSETFPSITNDGTLYFSRVSDDPRVEHIYRSRFVNGKYANAEKLPDQVNCGQTQFNAFVAPDESYLIVSVYGREDSVGSIDYYIVFRNQQDEWSEPINLGDKINTPGAQEYSSFVSRDSRYFFFMSTRLPNEESLTGDTYTLEGLRKILNEPENGNSDIYWMDAGFIESLRPSGF